MSREREDANRSPLSVLDRPESKAAKTRPKTKSRRWQLMERRGAFEPAAPEGIRVYRAVTPDDLCEAYRLVHDSFLREGYITDHPSGIRVRIFEALPQTATFIAKAKGRVIGCTSLVFDTPEFGLPLEKAFPEEVAAFRAHGELISEGTNWVIDPEYRRSGVLMELMRCCWAHALSLGCKHTFGAVSPGHQQFYELIGFDLAGAERSYSKDIHDPVVMVDLSFDKLCGQFAKVDPEDDDDIAALKRYYMEESPYHAKVGGWAQVSQAEFGRVEFLEEMFVRRFDLLDECGGDRIEQLRPYWNVAGRDLVEEVFYTHATLGSPNLQWWNHRDAAARA